MVKSAIFLIIVSVIVMFFEPQLSHVLRYMLTIHDKIADGLAMIFTNAPTGRMIQETMALIVIPVVIGAVAAFAWLIIKRNEMPHLVPTIWIIWTILLVTVLSQPTIHHSSGPKQTASKQQRTIYY
ncbi:MAG: hypothetical protein KDH94_00855 [Coxiellaceae bacterium]|nr:hypothetical protein [Coxiellaceae bacterium]